MLKSSYRNHDYMKWNCYPEEVSIYIPETKIVAEVEIPAQLAAAMEYRYAALRMSGSVSVY